MSFRDQQRPARYVATFEASSIHVQPVRVAIRCAVWTPLLPSESFNRTVTACVRARVDVPGIVNVTASWSSAAPSQGGRVKLLGHDFGTTPFGIHQVLEFRRRETCTCDPAFADVAHDVDCPTHGLVASLEQLQGRPA